MKVFRSQGSFQEFGGVSLPVWEVYSPDLLPSWSHDVFTLHPFQLFFLWMVTSTTTTFFSCLSVTTISGWFAATILWVWIWRSSRILAQLFSITLVPPAQTQQMFLCPLSYLPAPGTLLLSAAPSQEHLSPVWTSEPVCCANLSLSLVPLCFSFSSHCPSMMVSLLLPSPHWRTSA